jgi:hypothetical protein
MGSVTDSYPGSVSDDIGPVIGRITSDLCQLQDYLGSVSIERLPRICINRKITSDLSQ